ncbi:MAG: hypothetical protein OEW12_10375, partial [Deltaproteobacteria bacterium]|nr:hypothetical protein [Deltaproteobacteria bacterium]
MGFKQRLVSGGFKNTLLAGAVLALCLGAATRQVQAQMAPHEFHPPKAAPDILSQLTQLQGRGVAVAADKATGFARLIGVGAQTPLAAPGMAPGLPPQSNARMALDTYGPLFGLTNPRANTALMKQEVDADGRAMVRYQQTHNGVPVIGGELIVNLTPDGKMTSINGEVSAGLTLAATPRITPDQAAAAALAGTAKWNNEPQANLQASVPVLSVYDPQRLAPDTSPPVLVWRVEVTHTGLAPIRELVLVDALLGGVRLHFNQAADVRNRNTYDFGGVRDTSPSTLPGTFQCGEAATGSTGCTSTAIPDADNVHAFTADTYDFYWNTHGRDSMDGLGMTLTSTTRYCTFSTLYACPYANAYWNGAQMVYGAGVVADDITAHELTHAFTNKTSNLFYFYQSG